MIKVQARFEQNNFKNIVISNFTEEELELIQNLTIIMFKYHRQHMNKINKIEAMELTSKFGKVQQSIASKYEKKNLNRSNRHYIEDPLEVLSFLADNLDLLDLFEELNERFKRLYETEVTYVFETYEDKFETMLKTRVGTIFNLTKIA